MSGDGRDSLMLAMTRPPVFAGVPVGAFASVLSAGMLVFAATNNVLWGLVVAGPLYLVSRLVVLYDINAFTLLALWLRTRFAQSLFASNRKLWGGNSYSPTAIHLARRKGFGRVETSL
ncbi:MAG: VirB3 family type IV secretion system protein [Sphingomonadales bacterium]|nr:VirB3 family type IV secretion system protein [Sphingomonadales bacterium]